MYVSVFVEICSFLFFLFLFGHCCFFKYKCGIAAASAREEREPAEMSSELDLSV